MKGRGGLEDEGRDGASVDERIEGIVRPPLDEFMAFRQAVISSISWRVVLRRSVAHSTRSLGTVWSSFSRTSIVL